MPNETEYNLLLATMWRDILNRLDGAGAFLWEDVASDIVVEALAEFGFTADDDDRIQTAMQIGFMLGIENAQSRDDLPLDGQVSEDDEYSPLMAKIQELYAMALKAYAEGGIVLSDENDGLVPEDPKPEITFKVEKVFKASTTFVPCWTVVAYEDDVAKGGDHHWVAEEFATRALLLYSVDSSLHGATQTVLDAAYWDHFGQEMFRPIFSDTPGALGRWEGGSEQS